MYVSQVEVVMSRMQLALNVDDLDQAVEFYSKLFNVAPAKRKPGYANFAIAETGTTTCWPASLPQTPAWPAARRPPTVTPDSTS